MNRSPLLPVLRIKENPLARQPIDEIQQIAG